MNEDKTKRGQLVADKIRNLLFNIDLRILAAEGEIKVAEHDFRLNTKIKSPKHQQNAVKAKVRKQCYSVYIDNLRTTKKEIIISLDRVLSKYSSNYKKIWIMYFIEKQSIDKIMEQVSYSRDNINKIIQKFRQELASFTEVKKGEKYYEIT